MVELREMRQGEFDAFRSRAITDYAIERVETGEWPTQDAHRRARIDFEKLLPGGLGTPLHQLCTIFDTDLCRGGGSAWVQLRHLGGKPIAHVLDLYVAEPYRRKGYARSTMLLLERQLQAQGGQEMTLHVFDRNLAAQVLYQSLGYQANESGMAKNIGQAAST